MAIRLIISIYLLFTLMLLSCEEKSMDSQATQIVKRAIEAHGGMHHWENIKTLQFRKKTWLYKADSTLEKRSDELHVLHQKEKLNGTIRPFDTSDKSYAINFADGKGTKTLSDTIVAGTNPFLASHFVVNQPFKMLDPGVELSYLGMDTLENGKAVNVIKAYYGNVDDDIWWFYFDQETHILLSTLIYHAPTYAYVVNDKIKEIDGFLWNTKRTTYRTDSLRNKAFVRARFEYAEISVQ